MALLFQALELGTYHDDLHWKDSGPGHRTWDPRVATNLRTLNPMARGQIATETKVHYSEYH